MSDTNEQTVSLRLTRQEIAWLSFELSESIIRNARRGQPVNAPAATALLAKLSEAYGEPASPDELAA